MENPKFFLPIIIIILEMIIFLIIPKVKRGTKEIIFLSFIITFSDSFLGEKTFPATFFIIFRVVLLF